MAKSILIVDDEPAIRTAFSRALTEAGYTVTAVGTPNEAVQAVGKTGFHAILLDFTLPGSDGSVLHERLEQASPALASRIIFVTGWGGDDKTRKLLEHTGRPVLTKPVELTDLVAAVKKVTG